MTTTACTLAALLIFEAAGAPGKEACELDDDRCKAALYERRAATAANADHRARYLSNAHNLYLRLFDKTGDAQDLCAARRAIEASLAVDGQPASVRSESEALRAKLLARAKQQGARCKSKAQRRATPTDAPLVARASTPDPTRPDAPLVPAAKTIEAPTSPAPNAGASTRRASTPGGALRLLVDADTATSDDGLMPVAPKRAPSARRSSVPRPGRGLVTASGVSLGVGVALGLSAGLIDGRLTDTRRAIDSLSATIGDGYGTEAQNMLDDKLRADYRALTHQRAGLAIGAGATVVVAIVLAAVGGRKLARATSRAALLPAPGGLVFRGHF